MKKIIKKIGIVLFWMIFYFLFAGEMIFYPNVTARFIANIIICIVIAWLLYEKEIKLIIYDTGTWIYKTNKTKKINDTNEVLNGFGKLSKINVIVETVKLSCLLIGLSILIPIVYYIEYQDKKSLK